jgi:hypothetical protein
MKPTKQLPLTPITEETFLAQGWQKVELNGSDNDYYSGYDDTDDDDDEDFMEGDYYWVLTLPKSRIDEYAPRLVSNRLHEREILAIDMRLRPNEYVVQIDEMEGLGFCKYEEEIEVLYKALTGEDLYS